MEADSHKLDLELAEHTRGKTGDRDGFLKYSAAIHELTKLGEEKEKSAQYAYTLDGALTTIALHLQAQDPRLHVFRKEAVLARERL